jgi:chromosome segregation ATPase
MPVDIEPSTLDFVEQMPKDQAVGSLQAPEVAPDLAPAFLDDDLQQIETQIAELWRALDEVVTQFAVERQKREERLRDAEARQQNAGGDIARLLDNKGVLTAALQREHELVNEHQAAVRRFMSVSGETFGSDVASLLEPVQFLAFARQRIRELERQLDQAEVAYDNMLARMTTLEESTLRARFARWRQAWRGLWRAATAHNGMRRSVARGRQLHSR